MDGRHRIPDLTAAGEAAAAELRRVVAGRVSTTPLSRWLYSTDSSGYRVVPQITLVAAAVDDIVAAAAVAARYGLPLTARGAASSLAGQAIGAGIVLDCFKLDRILAIDPDRRLARVEPGVIQASLNRAAAPFGLEFGPDTSTVDQATIGGMVANNSSGSRSIVYGESKDKVRRIAVVLAGGEPVVLGPEMLGAAGGDAPAGRLASAFTAIRDRHRDALVHGWPPTSRCTSGYNLRELLAPAPNPARLLAGSEGTLALFTELEVSLDALPARRVGAAFTFATVREALEANVAILGSGPSAIELLDLAPLRRSPKLITYRRLAPLLYGDEQAMLTVEYQGEDDEAHEGLARLRALEGSLGARRSAYLTEPSALGEAAALRRAVLPLLMGAPGAERPASFVEDTAVAPAQLAAFVEDFRALVAAHGVTASFTGHASAGCLHVRPLLDLKTAAGVARMDALAAAVGKLVLEYHGVISGEHGCGRSRSWFLPSLYGEEIMAAFAELKAAFDPQDILNPGVILEGADVTDDLRFGTNYRAAAPWRPRLSYAAEGGFDAAVERCFGAGICKKVTGTMCPPAAASRDEAHTTRARANALQAILCGALSVEQLGDDELREALGTCVACKACKDECPAGVDMAALKVEWLGELRAREGVPLLARGIGDFRRLARLMGPAAPAVNALAGHPVARLVTDRLGVACDRPLPAFARRRLTRLAIRTGGEDGGARGGAEVLLLADCFVEHQEPEVGLAALELLRAAGRRVSVVDAGCCGRTALSTGQIEKARRSAAAMLDRLAPEAQAGRVIAVLEPSCLSMLVDDWRRLLPDDERVPQLADRAHLVQELVAGDAEAGLLAFAPGGAALLHPHCHERALVGVEPAARALRAVPGLELTVLDAGCCGMSGIFGYEAEHYETSVAIAERALLPAVRGAGPGVAVLATGTSCRAQIRDLAGRPVDHPLVFLRSRLLEADADRGRPAKRRRAGDGSPRDAPAGAGS